MTPTIADILDTGDGAIPASQDRSAALRAEPPAESQAEPAATIAERPDDVRHMLGAVAFEEHEACGGTGCEACAGEGVLPVWTYDE
jgi:hypothetical protein